MNSNPVFIFANAFEYKSERGKYFVIGYLSTPDIDLVNDMVTKDCLKDMLKQIKSMEIGAMKANIEHEHIFNDTRIIPVGKVVDAGLDGKGLWIKVQLNDSLPEFKTIWESIRQGYLDAFSIEYQPIDYDYNEINGKKVRVLKKIKLFGLAFTGRPANPEAKIVDAFVKSIQGDIMEKEETKKKITNFEEVRKKLGMSVDEFYAIPRDPPSASKLPIFDAAHVRNAIARFNQVEGVTPEEKKKAWNKILKAAKKFGIEVSKDNKKKEAKNEDVKKDKEDVKEDKEVKSENVKSEEPKPKEEKSEEQPKEEKEEVKEEPKKEETEKDEVKALKNEIEELKKQLAEVKARTEDNKLIENVKSVILEEIKNLEPEKKPLVKSDEKFKEEKVDVKNMSVGEIAQKILFRG